MGEKGGTVRQNGGEGRLGVREVALYGVLAAVALIFGYLEMLLPLPVPVPGVKLGLGNLVVLFALAAFGWRPALVLSMVKVVASALLFGNPAVFAYSLAGALTSLAAMCLASRTERLSLVGVSMVGGVFHMVGQGVVVCVVLSPAIVLAYLPVLLVAGLLTGALVGVLCRIVLRTAARSSTFVRRFGRVGANPQTAGEPAHTEGD